MAWQQISTQKTLLSSAVTLVLIGSAGISHAVTVGSTQINSAQYEPLNAVIEVKDIDPNEFSAKIADSRVYEQMELENNNRLNVNFVRTSDTSGKLVVTSVRPVKTPYQNIILDMSQGGQSTLLPKTLLVAADRSNQKSQYSKQPESQTNSPIHDDHQFTDTSQVNLTTASGDENANVIARSESALGNTNTNTASAVIAPPVINPPVVSDTQAINSNALSIQEVRVYQQNGQSQEQTIDIAEETMMVDNTPAVSNDNVTVTTANDTAATTNRSSFVALNEPPIGELPSDQILLNAIGTDTGNATGRTTDEVIAKQSQPAATQQPSTPITTQASTTDTSGRTTYVVQRNDNLWIISNDIAKRNNVSVYQVMKQIQQDNPDAFIDGKASRIIANAEIVLPDYEVIPSQSSLEKALAAKRAQLANEQTPTSQRLSKANTAKASTKKTSSKAPATNYKAKKNTSRPASKAAKPASSTSKPSSRVALVTPNTRQSQQSSTSGTGVSKDLISRLKDTRQSTASTVKTVNGLNSKFNDYSKKLEVQNDKIAQLEAKLKELKNK